MAPGIFLIVKKHGPYDDEAKYTWLYDILEDGEIRDCWDAALLADLSELSV